MCDIAWHVCDECGYDEKLSFFDDGTIGSFYCLDEKKTLCESCFFSWRDSARKPYIFIDDSIYEDDMFHVTTFEEIDELSSRFGRPGSRMWFFGETLMIDEKGGQSRKLGNVWNYDPKDSGLECKKRPTYKRVRLD